MPQNTGYPIQSIESLELLNSNHTYKKTISSILSFKTRGIQKPHIRFLSWLALIDNQPPAIIRSRRKLRIHFFLIYFEKHLLPHFLITVRLFQHAGLDIAPHKFADSCHSALQQPVFNLNHILDKIRCPFPNIRPCSKEHREEVDLNKPNFQVLIDHEISPKKTEKPASLGPFPLGHPGDVSNSFHKLRSKVIIDPMFVRYQTL